MVSVVWGVGGGVGVKICVVCGCGWLSYEPVINRWFCRHIDISVFQCGVFEARFVAELFRGA